MRGIFCLRRRIALKEPCLWDTTQLVATLENLKFDDPPKLPGVLLDPTVTGLGGVRCVGGGVLGGGR